jgi:hypothetical protein
MMLHRESSPLLGREVTNEESASGPLIVTLAQEENAEVNELLGKYFQNDDQNYFCKLNVRKKIKMHCISIEKYIIN